MGQLPSHLHNYIISTKDVASDGHCGFRAIADLLGYTEDSWGRVRGELFYELSSNHELYSAVFMRHDHVGKILNSINYYNERAPEEHWFCLPEMGYLVASAYNVALVCLDRRMSLTYLPLRTAVPCTPKLICIGFVNNNHFIEVHILQTQSCNICSLATLVDMHFIYRCSCVRDAHYLLSMPSGLHFATNAQKDGMTFIVNR